MATPDVSNLLTTAETIRQGGDVLKKPSTFERFFGRGSINERLERGFRVASPDFRQVREQQESDRREEKEFEIQNRFIAFDDAFRDTEPPVKKFLIKKAREMGILITDESGREGVRAGEGQKALQELQDEPQEIIALNNLAIGHHRNSLASLKELEENEINKIVNKTTKDDPSSSPMETKERITKFLRTPGNQTDILRQITADREFLNEKIAGLRGENVSLTEQKDLAGQLTGETRNIALELAKGGAVTPEIIAEANKRRQEERIEGRTAERTAIIEATQEADLNKVLPPDQIVKFINRDTNQPATFGMTNRDLIDGNFVPVTASQKGSIAALGSADNIIKTMKPIVDRLFTAGGFVSRVGETAGVIFQREFLGETDAVFYESLKEGVIGQFVKIVGGESGSRLSDQDIKRMRGLFPAMHAGVFGLIDTRETAQRKMEFLTQNMEKLRNDILSKAGVEPVGTLAEKFGETSLPELPRTDIGTFGAEKQSELDDLIGGQ